MALSREDNDNLTRTGAGTLMGDFLRRFWVPALLPEELPGTGLHARARSSSWASSSSPSATA